MAGIGIAFIANVFAMVALGLGLIVRGFFPHIASVFAPLASNFGFELPLDLGKTYIPHGFMIGAGLVSLIQAIKVILRKKEATEATSVVEYATSPEMVKKALLYDCVMFAAGALVLALLSGLWTGMSGEP